jgi:hypothetical protein
VFNSGVGFACGRVSGADEGERDGGERVGSADSHPAAPGRGRVSVPLWVELCSRKHCGAASHSRVAATC